MDRLSKHPLNVLTTLASSVITVWSFAERWQWGAWIFLFLFVASLVSLFLPKRKTGSILPAVSLPPAAPSLPTREQRWVTCAYCGGSGKVVVYHDRTRTQQDLCVICHGNGNYLTDRWSQPDCQFCAGTGRVMTHRSRYQRIYAICAVCGGIGRRPFTTAAYVGKG